MERPVELTAGICQPEEIRWMPTGLSADQYGLDQPKLLQFGEVALGCITVRIVGRGPTHLVQHDHQNGLRGLPILPRP